MAKIQRGHSVIVRVFRRFSFCIGIILSKRSAGFYQLPQSSGKAVDACSAENLSIVATGFEYFDTCISLFVSR